MVYTSVNSTSSHIKTKTNKVHYLCYSYCHRRDFYLLRNLFAEMNLNLSSAFDPAFDAALKEQ